MKRCENLFRHIYFFARLSLVPNDRTCTSFAFSSWLLSCGKAHFTDNCVDCGDGEAYVMMVISATLFLYLCTIHYYYKSAHTLISLDALTSRFIWETENEKKRARIQRSTDSDMWRNVLFLRWTSVTDHNRASVVLLINQTHIQWMHRLFFFLYPLSSLDVVPPISLCYMKFFMISKYRTGWRSG